MRREKSLFLRFDSSIRGSRIAIVIRFNSYGISATANSKSGN